MTVKGVIKISWMSGVRQPVSAGDAARVSRALTGLGYLGYK